MLSMLKFYQTGVSNVKNGNTKQMIQGMMNGKLPITVKSTTHSTETVGAIRIFQRSVTTKGLKYKKML